MAQMMSQPVTQGSNTHAPLKIGRAAEDYLDWVENHQRADHPRRGVSAVLLGAAFTLTAATVAALAFAGF